MNSYQIVGLTLTTYEGNSYKIKDGSRNCILHDKSGRGITQNHLFTKYILYVLFKDIYYAIHLSSSHCASYGGKLCSLGDIRIVPSDSTEIMSNITHYPVKQLFVPATFELENYDEDIHDYEEDICICLSKEPDICVFKFSHIGGSERTPCGYVYVNMDLFYTF
jgi:hypothetical protein